MLNLNKVHSDDRRTISVINNLLEDNKEFSIIQLKKGKAIGGCMHKNPEYMCLISGLVQGKFGDEQFLMIPGEAQYIPQEEPHAFFAEEDSVIIEWGITEEEKKKSKKYFKLLEEVKNFNDKSNA